MAIALASFAAAANGIASAAPAYPSSIAAGDLVLCHVTNKPFGSTPSLVGLMPLASVTSGSVANGNGTGSCVSTVAARLFTANVTGTDTVTVVSGSPTLAVMSRWTKASSKMWDIKHATAQDTTVTGTTVSAASAAFSLAVDDVVVITVALNDDVDTHILQTITASGITFSAITWETVFTTTSGNDAAMYVGRCTVLVGSGSVAATYAATSSGTNESATAVVFTRLREIDPALPGTIGMYGNPAVEPESHGHVPPIMDGNNNLYRAHESNLATTNDVLVHKSTDGGITWLAVDFANRPSATDIEAAWVMKVGTVMWTLVTRDDTVWLVPFNLSDAASTPDTYGTQETVDTGLSSTGMVQYCSFVRLSTGDMRMFYSDTLNGANNQIGMRTRTAPSTYSAKTTFDDGAVDVTGPAAVLGANDVTYVFYKDKTGDVLYYRTVSATGVVSARTAVASGAAISSQSMPHTNPVYYDDAGTEVIGIAYINDSDILKYREIRGGTLQTEETISTAALTRNPGATDSQSVVAHLAVDGTTVHAMWSRASDGDLLRDARVLGTGWGTDTVVWASGLQTGWYVYCLVQQRGTGVYLQYTYDQGIHVDDASNTTYNEILLRTVATTVNGTGIGAFGFTGTASGVPETFGVAAAPFGFTGTAAGVPETFGTATATFGFTATAAGQPFVTGMATAAFGFTGSVAGIDRALGVAAASLGFTGAAAGVDRALGAAAAALGFTGTASGVPETFGVAAGAFGFTGAAAGTPRVIGVAVAAFGFTGAASGSAGSPPVTGVAITLFGFTGSAAGVDRALGVAAGSFGFTGVAGGVDRSLGVAVTAFGFTGVGTGIPRLVGVAASLFGFTGAASGVPETFGAAVAVFGFTGAASGLASSSGNGSIRSSNRSKGTIALTTRTAPGRIG